MKQLLTFFLFFSFLYVAAQEKIDTIKINNTGTLTIELDSRINEAIKTRERTSCAIETRRVPEKRTEIPRPTGTSSDPCANQTQISGFKIQIFYSKNRNDAEKVRQEFDKDFPNMSSQVTYYAPDYRVLVGDYFTKKSASADIKRLKSRYNSAFSIPFKVMCRRAK